MNSPSLSPYKEFEKLQFDRPSDGVLRITLNRVDTLNSVSADMHRELVRVWPIISEDNNSRVVLVRGAGRLSVGGSFSLVERSTASFDAQAIIFQEANRFLYTWPRGRYWSGSRFAL